MRSSRTSSPKILLWPVCPCCSQQRDNAPNIAVAHQLGVMQEEQQELVASNVQHQAEKAKLEEATLPLMLEVMWAANVLDIQSTLRHVARVVGPRSLAEGLTRLRDAAFLLS